MNLSRPTSTEWVPCLLKAVREDPHAKVESVNLDSDQTICHLFRPRITRPTRLHRSTGATRLCTANYASMPSFDHTQPITRSRPGEDHWDSLPLLWMYKYTDSDWFEQERRKLGQLYDRISNHKVLGKEELLFDFDGDDGDDKEVSHDLFEKRARFGAVKKYAKTFHMEQPVFEDQAGVLKLPDDETLTAWLLLRHNRNELYAKQWIARILNAMKDLQKVLNATEVVAIMDEYRTTISESKLLCFVPSRPVEMRNPWQYLCPLHLHYRCPYHAEEPTNPDSNEASKQETRRPAAYSRVKHHRASPSDFQTRLPCGEMCWKSERDLSEEVVRSLSSFMRSV
jgi:hypothetical protein